MIDWNIPALHRFGRRSLTLVPGFVAVAAAIGVAAPLLAFLDHSLLRPPPFVDPGRIVVAQVLDSGTGSELMLGADQVETLRSLSGAFLDVGAFAPAGTSWPGDIAASSPATWCFLDSSGFRVLGVPTALGRTFTEADERAGEAVAVISYELWRQAYGGSPAVLGVRIRRGLTAGHRIIGVMPKGFRFPIPAADVWAPFPVRAPGLSDVLSRRVVARLQPGVTRHAAQAWAEGQLRRARTFEQVRILLTPVADAMSASARTAAPLLVIGLFAVLALSTAVLSHLLLLEALRSRFDIGVRMALGASRSRVLSVFPLKGLLVALFAGCTGVLLSSILARSGAPHGLGALMVQTEWLDGRVLCAAGAMSAAAGLMGGLIPVIAYWRTDVSAFIGSTGLGAPGRARLLWRLLTATQSCCAVMFVIWGALTWMSMVKLGAVSTGFPTDRLLAVSVTSSRLLSVPLDQMARSSSEFFEELVERARRLPGVADAAATTNLPIHGNGNRVSFYSGVRRPECELAEIRGVSAGYFRTLGLPIEEGRLFTERESLSSGRVAVVNRVLARGCWPGQSAIGQTGRLPFGSWRVVGVVGDVPMFGLRKPPVPEVYVSMIEWAVPFMQVLLRVTGADPYGVLPAFRRTVTALDPEAFVSTARSVEDILAGARAPLSLRATLLRHAAVSTLVVALLGVYAATAFIARGRRRERAIRVALGAAPAAVLARSTMSAVGWNVPGVLAGAGLAYWGASSLAPVLFGVAPFELWVYGASVTLVCLMAAGAAWLGGLDIFDADLLHCLQDQ